MSIVMQVNISYLLRNIENTFTQISVTLISAHTLLIHFVTWKTCLFISPFSFPLVNAYVCEILFFPFTLYRAISFFMSLTISITLNSFVHCVSLLCSRFTSSISFTTSFKTTYSLPSLTFASSSSSPLPIFLPAVQECALKTCFNLTNKKHWSQLAEEWRMEVEREKWKNK